MNKPSLRPRRPLFSSGPCAKHPGWTVNELEDAALGRSHRSEIGKAKLKLAIDKSREILELPDDYRLAIVPASDTGAVEMALWSLLGARPVDMLAWESFGSGWVTDVVKQLRLDDARVISADYGQIPDLRSVDWSHDVVFTWNGTTSGVRVPDGNWISSKRDGLAICDATSAAFAMKLPWDKLDVATYSWQKVLGGEAAHGVLILSPRAVSRLENYTPPWPLPKIFRLTMGGKLIEGLFEGATINTPSMLAVEDYLNALAWAEQNGGLDGLIERTDRNADILDKWVSARDWIDYLAEDPAIRSTTSVCLKIVDPWFQNLSDEDQAMTAKAIVARLEGEEVAYDIGAYRDAPQGLRIWCGATVEPEDIDFLCPWLDWAFEAVRNS